jgi:hypothetical protein
MSLGSLPRFPKPNNFLSRNSFISFNNLSSTAPSCQCKLTTNGPPPTLTTLHPIAGPAGIPHCVNTNFSSRTPLPSPSLWRISESALRDQELGGDESGCARTPKSFGCQRDFNTYSKLITSRHLHSPNIRQFIGIPSPPSHCLLTKCIKVPDPRNLN